MRTTELNCTGDLDTETAMIDPEISSVSNSYAIQFVLNFIHRLSDQNETI